MNWVKHPTELVDIDFNIVLDDIANNLDYPINQMLDTASQWFGYTENELLGMALRRYWEIQEDYGKIFFGGR
jgi:hypothetical protein